MNTPMRNFALSVISIIGVVGFVAVSFAEGITPVQSPLRILVANDDGIDSPGLHALALALSEIGEVVVSAPEENCSGASQSSKIFSGTHRAHLVEVEGAVKAWAIEGTPSDAVTWGLLHEGKEKPFDFVVSGINGGANVGEIAHYSGTIGAAMEGAAWGIPSIAVSQTRQDSFEVSCAMAVKLVQRLVEDGATPQTVWAIEVPRLAADAVPEVVFAPMAGRYVEVGSFQVKKNEDGGFVFRPQLTFPREHVVGGATHEFQLGKVVITPLRYNWTDEDELQRMRGWDW